MCYASSQLSALFPRVEETLFTQETLLRLRDTVEALFVLFSIGDPVAAVHSVRTAVYAATLIRAVVGEETHMIEFVRLAALLHDIGKVGVAKEVLYKEGTLSPEEFELMKSHAWLGTLPLERHPLLRPFVRVVRHVHEHFNGAGYPDGLCGFQIPFEARVIAVADTFDALTTDRPYRSALSLDEAFRVLRLEAGQRLDPRLVNIFITLWRREGFQLLPAEAVQFPLNAGQSVFDLLISLERLLEKGRNNGYSVQSGEKKGLGVKGEARERRETTVDSRAILRRRTG